MPKSRDFPLLITALCASVVLASCLTTVKEKEPNDTADSAQTLSRASAVSGSLDPSDTDVFLLPPSGETNDLWRFDLIAPGASNLVLQVSENGRIAGTATLTGPGGTLCLVPFPAAGRSLLTVSRSPGERTNLARDYRLTRRMIGKSPALESEPNDTMVTADPVPEGNCVSGFHYPASGSGDEDWFRFETSDEGLTLRADLTAVEGTDPALDIFAASGVVIETADRQGPDEGETLLNVGLQQAGAYFLRVRTSGRGMNQDHPYRLVLTPSAAADWREPEDNDSFRNANPLLPARPLKGLIAGIDDADWFVIEPVAAAPGRRACGDISLTAVEGVNLSLTVLDARMQTLRVMDNSGESGPENLRALRLDASRYLRVSSLGGANPGQEYILSLRAYEQKPNQETEPNDESADSVDPGRAVSGSADRPGDVDLFLFAVPKACSLKAELSTEDQRAGYGLRLFKADRHGRQGAEIRPSGEAYKLPRARYIARVECLRYGPDAFYSLTFGIAPKK
jgi:hypothetical protein